jgi:glycosyltransferase involved in cell wall biosynthesis
MLIGIDASRALRARRTGTERYALEITRHLLTLPTASEHTWRLYVQEAPPPGLFSTQTPTAVRPNVEIALLPARRLWTHGALARAVVRAPPDVLFVPAHVLPLLWPARRRPTSVVTIHDLGYHHVPQAHPFGQRLYLQLSTRWSAAAATRLIAVSHTTAADLTCFYGTPAARVRVIYEGIPPASAPSRAEVEAVGQRHRLLRPYALYVGTIQPRKNLARLLQAYAGLRQRNQVEWDLVLVGGVGWLSQPLYALASELGLAECVHFLGYVPDADLPALYGGARLFCFPSLFEGFGLPLLEAQSYGAPVMAANNSALPEIAGDAALLVDPLDVEAIAQAMLRLSQDEVLRQRLIAAGYENLKRFSWEKAARETLAVLVEAAGQGDKGNEW